MSRSKDGGGEGGREEVVYLVGSLPFTPDAADFGTEFTCFTGTKVQILTLEIRWTRQRRQVGTLLALLVQKYKY